MYTGRKVILTKPVESDAKTLQKWYLDKDFRYWYDSYVSYAIANGIIEQSYAEYTDALLHRTGLHIFPEFKQL